jgi:guanylate kinase
VGNAFRPKGKECNFLILMYLAVASNINSEETLAVFVKPPSVDELKKIKERSTETTTKSICVSLKLL